MSEHYYTAKPTTGSKESQITVELRGFPLKLWTDRGVFSREGVDFGSQLLIETMEIPEDAEVLDVGCGYGPIGLTAATLANRGKVTLIDINERAVELANKNIALNGIDNARAIQSNVYSNISGLKFDVILTNPPIRAGKAVVHEILEGAYDKLNEGGSLWVVIQKKQGSPSAWNKLEEVFGEVEEVTKDKGYRIFRAKKN